jgi:hypothetical protein
MSESATEQFLTWYEQAKAKGLKSINFCPADTSMSTVESFLEEVNAVRRAVDRGEFQELSDEI